MLHSHPFLSFTKMETFRKFILLLHFVYVCQLFGFVVPLVEFEFVQCVPGATKIRLISNASSLSLSRTKQTQYIYNSIYIYYFMCTIISSIYRDIWRIIAAADFIVEIIVCSWNGQPIHFCVFISIRWAKMQANAHL